MSLDDFVEPIELCDLQIPDISKRSRLYHLEPIGIGTPYVESLTSYFTRLAEAHSLNTGFLLLSEIGPLIKEGYVFNEKNKHLAQIYGGTRHSRTALNGTGSMATTFVKAIETLTKTENLKYLTLLNFAEVVSHRFLLRPCKAWCPICYKDWITAGQDIYEPLIWSLSLVTICPRHHQPLHTQCPHCHRQVTFLGSHSRPGYCSKCQKWLGVTQQIEGLDNPNLLEAEQEWQLWVIKNIGQLIESSPYLSFPYPRKTIQQLISNYLIQATQGDILALAKLLGQPIDRVLYWYNNEQLPTLNTLLKICSNLEISLLEFLNAKVVNINNCKFNLVKRKISYIESLDRKIIEICQQKIELVLIAACNEYPPQSLRSVLNSLGLKSSNAIYTYFPELSYIITSKYRDYCKKIKYESIRYQLLSALNSDEYPPPSMSEVSRRIKVNDSILYKYFGEICHAISAKFANYRHERSKKRQEEIRQQVRQAAFQIHGTGKKPNAANIGKILSTPKLMFNDIAVSALEEVLRELGYD